MNFGFSIKFLFIPGGCRPLDPRILFANTMKKKLKNVFAENRTQNSRKKNLVASALTDSAVESLE